MTGDQLVASVGQTIAAVATARQNRGHATDMLDPHAAEDLARNLAQAILGALDEEMEAESDVRAALRSMVRMIKRNGGYMTQADQAALLAAERVAAGEP